MIGPLERLSNHFHSVVASFSPTKHIPKPEFPAPREWPTQEIRAKLVNSAYREMTENFIDKSQGEKAWIALDQYLTRFSKEEVAALYEAVGRNDWDAQIFDDVNLFPYLGLAALKEGQLNSLQFGTLMSYWSARQHHDRKTIQVIKIFGADRTLNPQAGNIIAQTMAPTKNYANHDFTKYFSSFIDKLRLNPSSEHVFFVVPDDTNPESDIFFQRTISRSINEVGINVFCRFEEKSSPKRMIPSFGMQQAFLDVISPGRTFKIEPKINLGTLQDFERCGLSQKRISSLPFVQNPLPLRADFYRALLSYDFIYHDFYHAILCSVVPPEHQLAIITLALEFKNLHVSRPEYDEIKQGIYEALIDMEAQYSIDQKNEYPENLHTFLNKSIYLAIKNLAAKKIVEKADYLNLSQKQVRKLHKEYSSKIEQTFQQMIKKEDVLQKAADRAAPAFKRILTLEQLRALNKNMIAQRNDCFTLYLEKSLAG